MNNNEPSISVPSQLKGAEGQELRGLLELVREKPKIAYSTLNGFNSAASLRNTAETVSRTLAEKREYSDRITIAAGSAVARRLIGYISIDQETDRAIVDAIEREKARRRDVTKQDEEFIGLLTIVGRIAAFNH